MLQMMKRDFLINRFYFLIIFLALPVFYVMDLSPLFMFAGMMLGGLFNVFYYEGHNHVNRFISSMPIKKEITVIGRYIFLQLVILFFILYLWVVDIVSHYGLPYISYQPLTLFSLILTITFINIIIAISIPIYYFFQSFMKSLLFQGALFIMFVVSFIIIVRNFDLLSIHFIASALTMIESLLSVQPYLVPILFSIVCLFLSYKLSVRIFTKKDIQ